MSNHYFFVLRYSSNEEVVGIVRTPRNTEVCTVYHPGMTSAGIMTHCITKAEYETYKEFKLFQEYEWVKRVCSPHVRGYNGSNGSWGFYIDIYDPTEFEYFAPGKNVVRRNVMPNA